MQSATVPAESILQAAIADETGLQYRKIWSPDALRFSNPGSIVSELIWSPYAYRSLARTIQPALLHLHGKVPEMTFRKCLEACLDNKLLTLNRYGLRLLLRGKTVMGVLSWRAVYVQPSTIIRSAMTLGKEHYSIRYQDLEVSVTFRGRLLDQREAFLTVSSRVQDGWALRRNSRVWYKDSTSRSCDRLRRWLISDWESAFLSLKTELSIPT